MKRCVRSNRATAGASGRAVAGQMAVCAALALFAVCGAGPAQAVVIDFENLSAPGYGTPGLKVGNQYASQGVTFNFPTALDYSTGTPAFPGFAHSGTKAIELCYASEFCTAPLVMNFSAAQSRVKVWLGYSHTLAVQQVVILRAFNGSGALVSTRITVIGPGTGAVPIATPLEIVDPSSSMVRVTVGFLGAEAPTPTIFNNALAVDDVEFDTGGPPPPCPSSTPPFLTVQAPIEGKIVLANRFDLRATVGTPDPFATLRLDVAGSGGTRTFGPVYVFTGKPSPFIVSIAGITDLLFPGQNDLTITLQDCAGSTVETRTVFHRTDITSTFVHVRENCVDDAWRALVFADGEFVGVTDPDGLLEVRPPLEDGTKLVVQHQVYLSPTHRDHHQDWKFRAYMTNLSIQDDGSTRAQEVVLEPDPLAPQEICVSPANTVVGIHIVASLEWDASEAELEAVRDSFTVASEYLYNATDGQMLFEQVDIVDNARFWHDADYRFYANQNLRANVDCPFGSFFEDEIWCGRSWVRLPRPGSGWYAKHPTYVHEFGHYAFSLDDEYSTPGIKCTALLDATTGPFRMGQPKASCMMWGESVAPKLCSGVAENPHVHGTLQGATSCWSAVASRFHDAGTPREWAMVTPEDRGHVVGTINGRRLPVRDWKPIVTIDNGSKPNLCAPLTINVVDQGGAPVADVGVWVIDKSGLPQIYQGRTDAAGQILVTGAHVGDKVIATKFVFATLAFFTHTITDADCVPASGPAALATETTRAVAEGGGGALPGVKVWPSPLAKGEALHVGFAAPVDAQGKRSSDLAVSVYDVMGRRVASLVPGYGGDGLVVARWDGRGPDGQRMGPGLYVLRAIAPSAGFRMERKFVILP